MHIQRCDDPAYLSFARQLLRSLANVKDGTVTKHAGDVTVTVRKVFGHEYVSIASGEVAYEFFTTGDLYNSLDGLNLEELAKTEKYIIPRGYFIRAKSNGDAQLVLSTNEPFIGEKPVPHINQHDFFYNRHRINRQIQVSLITEPVFESAFGQRCVSVWSQRPTPYSDYEYDIVGNRLQGLATTPHVADTDWPRTVATTTRVHTDVNGVKTNVGLMVVVTQTWEVVIYKISEASEPLYEHPDYPQLLLTTKPDTRLVKLQIPLPAGMEKNKFDGSARETHKSSDAVYREQHRRMCVRINPDCTKLCFNYDEVQLNYYEPYKLNCFVEFELNIDVAQSGEIVASVQKKQSIDSGNPRRRVLDCDYLMPSKGGLAKKFEDLGCKTGDLIVLCQHMGSDEVFGSMYGERLHAYDNYLYVVNQTTGVVLIEIPSECDSDVPSDYDPETGMDWLNNSHPATFFEFIDLKSLSLAVVVENDWAYGGRGLDDYKAAYALFVHGKKFASAGSFDILFNKPVKKHRWSFPFPDRWAGSLDPTHNFVCDIFGSWSYHSFFYSNFFGIRSLTDSGGVTGATDDSLCFSKTFTHPKNMLTFAFDFVVFATKNAKGYSEKITSHKQLFEKATGLKFNTRWHKENVRNGVNVAHIVVTGGGFERNEAWGQIHGSITEARNMLRMYPVLQHYDSTMFANCPIVSAAGLFA
jgi:hypothetical protein